MRITVFGATGRTGRHSLAGGLRREHRTRSLAIAAEHCL